MERVIFLTNDDSYRSKGFDAAIEIARQFGRVIAIAPDTPQSGMSQAITIYNPLRLRKVREEEGVLVYSLNGTPVDCVKMAFDHFFKDEKIDLVISGINHGSNAAVNVLYSGTMGAAIEGAFYNIPSIGLSLTDHDPDMVDEIRKNIPLMKDLKPLDMPTNSQLYRIYIEKYLRSHPVVAQDLDLIIAQRQPGQFGLPIEVYFFLTDKVWNEFETIQSDIFDHLIAMSSEFGLKMYQLAV